MARKQSGGFNKFLNFIGLVDDAAPHEAYSEEYDSAGYERSPAYVPPRQRVSSASRRDSARKSLPAQAGRSRYGARTYGRDEEPRANRRAGRADGYDDYVSRAASRPRSRFEEEEAPARPERAERAEAERFDPPARPARGSGQRTMMFSLKTLYDANPVITALVRGNTIVMTIETNNPELRQRIVDTLSGAVFALSATIYQASDRTYLLAPKTVDVSLAYDVDNQF